MPVLVEEKKMRIKYGMTEGDVVRDVTHVNPDHIVQLLRSRNNKYYIIYRRNLMNAKTLRLQISKDIADKILEMPNKQAYDYMLRKISLAEGDL